MINMTHHVPLPCDLEHWPRIKTALVSLKEALPSCTNGLTLARRLDFIHRVFLLGEIESPIWNEHSPIKRSTFVELAGYLDKTATTEERTKWLTSTLPFLVEKAIDIERVKPARPLQYLRQYQECDIELSRPFISSLIACMFLCIIPEPLSSHQKYKLNDLTFHRFFSVLRKRCSQAGKLRCLLHYFDTLRALEEQVDWTSSTTPSSSSRSSSCGLVPGDSAVLRGFLGHRMDDQNQVLRVRRRVLPQTDLLTSPLLHSMDRPLAFLMVDSKGKMQEADPRLMRVDFANCLLGGGVLGGGCVQEEIEFCLHPELIATLLFTEALEDSEAIWLEGQRHFSLGSGYANSFKWAGPAGETLQRAPRVCAIDALPLFYCQAEQYSERNILREINKAYAGFHQGDEEVDEHSYLRESDSFKNEVFQRFNSMMNELASSTLEDGLMECCFIQAQQQRIDRSSDFGMMPASPVTTSSNTPSSTGGSHRGGASRGSRASFSSMSSTSMSSMGGAGSSRRSSGLQILGGNNSASSCSSRRSSGGSRKSWDASSNSSSSGNGGGGVFMTSPALLQPGSTGAGGVLVGTQRGSDVGLEHHDTIFEEMEDGEEGLITTDKSIGPHSSEEKKHGSSSGSSGFQLPFHHSAVNSSSSSSIQQQQQLLDEASGGNKPPLTRQVRVGSDAYASLVSENLASSLSVIVSMQHPLPLDEEDHHQDQDRGSSDLRSEDDESDTRAQLAMLLQAPISDSRKLSLSRDLSPNRYQSSSPPLRTASQQSSRQQSTPHRCVPSPAISSNGNRQQHHHQYHHHHLLSPSNYQQRRMSSPANLLISPSQPASSFQRPRWNNGTRRRQSLPCPIKVSRQNLLLSLTDSAKIAGGEGVLGVAATSSIPQVNLVFEVMQDQQRGLLEDWTDRLVEGVISEALHGFSKIDILQEMADVMISNVISDGVTESLKPAHIEHVACHLSPWADLFSNRIVSSGISVADWLATRADTIADTTLNEAVTNSQDRAIRRDGASMPAFRIPSLTDRSASSESSRGLGFQHPDLARLGDLLVQATFIGDLHPQQLFEPPGNSQRRFTLESNNFTSEEESDHSGYQPSSIDPSQHLSSLPSSTSTSPERSHSPQLTDFDHLANNVVNWSLHELDSRLLQCHTSIGGMVDRMVETSLRQAFTLVEQISTKKKQEESQHQHFRSYRESSEREETCFEDAYDLPYETLNSFSEGFTTQIMVDVILTLHNKSRTASRYQTGESGDNLRKHSQLNHLPTGVATGNWGCGAFGGDPQLKCLLQWLAASIAGLPIVLYYTMNDTRMQGLSELARQLIMNKWTVKDLYSALHDYSSCHQQEPPLSVFDFLQQKL